MLLVASHVQQLLRPALDFKARFLNKSAKFFVLAVLASLLLVNAASANSFSAGAAENKSRFSSWFSNSKQPQFLRVEEAFKFSGQVKGRQLVVQWQIAPEYYLYKDKTKIYLDKANTETDSAQILELGALNFPQALSHEDEYFGKTEVYYSELEVSAPLNSAAAIDVADLDINSLNKQSLNIIIEFQGCADAGLCYPPQKESLSLNLKQLDLTDPIEEVKSQSSAASQPPKTTASRLSEQLASGQTWLTLVLFFLAGLGLTFTPCVLPMLPILSRIILGSAASGDQNSALEMARPKTRGFILSSAYVTGMALTYALLGALMGWFGSSLNLPAAMQSPWLIWPAAAVFLLLALSLFGVFELRLPAWLDKRLQTLQQPKGGTLVNVALMGVLSTLIVSPCLSAPLAGALAYIATTGSVLSGSLALLFLGLGMGVPLIITGTFGAHWLPKAGVWMNQVKLVFGWLLLGMAAWLASRLLSSELVLLLGAVLSLSAGVFLGGLNFRAAGGWEKLRLSLGLLLILYGASLFLGALAGNTNPLQPLKGMGSQAQTSSTEVAAAPMLNSLEELEQVLTSSSQPVLVDLYADWCISCKVMEARVFPRAEIQQAMQGINRVKLDLTQIDSAKRAWLEEHQLFGPPTLMFFHNNQEATAWRIPGEVNAAELQQHLQAYKQSLGI